MLKKYFFIIISIFLIFSLTACGKKQEAVPMESINIDFNTDTVTNDTLTFEYPSDEWVVGESISPVIKIVLYFTGDNATEGTNINVGTSAPSKEITLDDYVALMPMQLEKSSPGTKVSLSELRTINDMEIGYMEMNTKITEDAINYGLEQGIFTEQTIEDAGGKEAFLNQPEVKQIQMSLYIGGNLTNITGTYYNDNEKEDVLKAMSTMVQTVK